MSITDPLQGAEATGNLTKQKGRQLLERFSKRKEQIVSTLDEGKLLHGFKEDSAHCQDQLTAAIDALVRSSEQVGSRRQSVNLFFLTINSLLLTAVGVIFSNLPPMGAIQLFVGMMGIGAIGALGLLLCSIWEGFLESYWAHETSNAVLIQTLEKRRVVRAFSEHDSIMSFCGYEPLLDKEQFVTHVFMLIHGVALMLAISCTVCMIVMTVSWS